MKIAISGKGGVGKTTLAALLAQTYADRGRAVLAVDSDPSPSLARALAFPDHALEDLRPISEMDELIEERTGAQPGAMGGFFTLNPKVDDLPDRYSVLHDRVRLLEMGSIDSGGSGCICPESAMLKTLFTHLLFRDDDVLILDMYAGVEHLGRATVDFVDALLIVVEPTRRSLATADQIRMLAGDIGLNTMWIVANRVRSDDDLAFLRREATAAPLIGHLPEDSRVVEADRRRESVYGLAPPMREAAARIADSLSGVTQAADS